MPLKPVPGPQLSVQEYVAKGEIEFDLTPHIETWRVLEKFYKQGVFKVIGISNFDEEQIQDLYNKAEIKPMNFQTECHVYLQQYELHEFCKKLGIVMTSYATLGNPGRLSIHKKEGDPEPLKHPYVLELAQKYNKDPGQILLRQMLQRGIAVIPKSTNPARIRSNKEVFDFNLTTEEMENFKAIKDYRRFFGLEILKNHPYYPRK
uniref:NADP-dependent oxidoreductase domain-containing protein n=1 Tax=Acrobeloides nanus TaxID=290746 RepID=A0A914EJ55_9BILA